jgi:hypothetical protein
MWTHGIAVSRVFAKSLTTLSTAQKRAENRKKSKKRSRNRKKQQKDKSFALPLLIFWGSMCPGAIKKGI